jgi:hypothetical protein
VKRLIFLLLVLLLASCATKAIKFEQYSVAMNLKVEADSSVVIGDDERFFGVIWLNPILKEEKVQPEKIKVIQNYGKYFVCANNFAHVWMVVPKGDGLSAVYKAIDVTPKDKADAYSDVGLSRYGSKENACVKFRFNKQEVFIDKKGKVNEKCNN